MKNTSRLSPPPTRDLSVVIPRCEAPARLADALAALSEQRHVRLEVIFIHEAPDTACAEVTQKFRQRGLDVTSCAVPGGSAPLGRRLKGMETATAPWLAFMEPDLALTGPDAFAEALGERGENADILHFPALSKNRWHLASVDEALAPLAEGPLAGREIFSAWLDSGAKAPVLWNKFYSRRLFEAVAKIPHTLRLAASADLYLSAWFFLLAKSYQPIGVPVYADHAQGGDAPERAAARALDCLRMYLELPALFAARGLPPEQGERLRRFLRALVTDTGVRLCDYLMGGPDGAAVVNERLEQVLHFGSEEEIFLALAVANGSNAKTLLDVSNLLKFSW